MILSRPRALIHLVKQCKSTTAVITAAPATRRFNTVSCPDKTPNKSMNLPIDDLTTKDRIHTFSVSCDKVVRLIKMGFLNKNLASQYCHYLIQLSKESETKDKQFYATRAFDLMLFLLRQSRELVETAKVKLMTDMSTVNANYCAKVCELLTKSDEFVHLTQSATLKELLESCYNFSEYQSATEILEKFDGKSLDTNAFDSLILGLEKFSKGCDGADLSARRQQFLDHLHVLIKYSQKLRVQFISKYQEDLIRSLTELGFEVTTNPTLKLSCRCTNCNSHLPAYDARETRSINSSIKSLLSRSVDDNVLLNTSPADLANFERFLEKIHNLDGKPFGCVIDGLNVAYQNATGYTVISRNVQENFKHTMKKLSPSSLGQVLINTIIRGGILQKFRKVLVVGRRHMIHWPHVIEFFEKNGIHHYLSFNHNKDDLYSLYAATLDPRTVLITNDFLRDHRALLKDEDVVRFERWIDTRQAWIAKKTLKPIWPTPFEKLPSIDVRNGHFHLPVIDSTKLASIAQHEPPPHLNSNMLTWLCCKIPADSESSEEIKSVK